MTMTYPAVIAHVYSSVDSYTTATATPRLKPFRASPFLGTLTVTVGRAPRWLFRATRRLYALDILRGGNFTGWLEGGLDPDFRLHRGELSRPWYTTFVLEVPPVRVDPAAWDTAMVHEATLHEAAVLLAANASANVIEKRELRGLFLQRGDGKWVKCPQFEMGTPSVAIGHSEGALRGDLLAAQATFRSLPAVRPATMRIDWALKALLSEEPWAQFVWFMFSLEQLTDEHFRAKHPTRDQLVLAGAEAYVRAAVPNASIRWSRPSITMQFAAVAAHLSPGTGAADTATFHSLLETRNRLLHGTQSEAPDGVTRQVARELALRYNKLVACDPIP